MKVKTYKKTNRNYEDIFTKEKETEEVRITISDYELMIAEQQMGMYLSEPQVEIRTPKCSYCMPLSIFIDRVSQ